MAAPKERVHASWKKTWREGNMRDSSRREGQEIQFSTRGMVEMHFCMMMPSISVSFSFPRSNRSIHSLPLSWKGMCG